MAVLPLKRRGWSSPFRAILLQCFMGIDRLTPWGTLHQGRMICLRENNKLMYECKKNPIRFSLVLIDDHSLDYNLILGSQHNYITLIFSEFNGNFNWEQSHRAEFRSYWQDFECLYFICKLKTICKIWSFQFKLHTSQIALARLLIETCLENNVCVCVWGETNK